MATEAPVPAVGVVEATTIQPGISILAQLPEGIVTHVATGPESLPHATMLITEFGLPNGLLPLQDVVECGYNTETGFVWITQKKAIVHKFAAISKQVSYGEKITAYLEQGRLKKLTGVKAKEILWVSIIDISLTGKDNLYFKSNTGIGKTFPASAFLKAATDASPDAAAISASDVAVSAIEDAIGATDDAVAASGDRQLL